MSISDENLVDAFFEETDFIENATYTPYGGSASTIPVFFDRENSITPIGGVVIENTAPQAIAKTSDVPTITNKATLAILGVTYYVQSIEPSATGLTVIKLSKMDI